MNALELHSISKSYGAQSSAGEHQPVGAQRAAERSSSARPVRAKPRLLRMIAGFEFPDSGRLSLNGQTLVDSTHEVPAHQRLIGYVPQDGALFPHMTVAANIGFGLVDQGP